jgi:cobaltochelatase CobN
MGIYHPTNPGETPPKSNPSRYTVVAARQSDNRCREAHDNPYRLRPDVIFISASDTELTVLEAARAQLPDGFPPLHMHPSYACKLQPKWRRFCPTSLPPPAW